MSHNRKASVMNASIHRFSGIAVMVICACAPGDRRPAPAVTADDPPDSVFHGLERRLLESTGTSIDFAITADRAHQANLAGNLTMEPGNRTYLHADGTFESDSFALRLVSNGTRMQKSNGNASSDHDTPNQLNGAIVIGLTRMGLLHNLAR